MGEVHSLDPFLAVTCGQRQKLTLPPFIESMQSSLDGGQILVEWVILHRVRCACHAQNTTHMARSISARTHLATSPVVLSHILHRKLQDFGRETAGGSQARYQRTRSTSWPHLQCPRMAQSNNREMCRTVDSIPTPRGDLRNRPSRYIPPFPLPQEPGTARLACTVMQEPISCSLCL